MATVAQQTTFNDAVSATTHAATIPSTVAGNALLGFFTQPRGSGTAAAITAVSNNGTAATWTFASTINQAGPPPASAESGANTAIAAFYAFNVAAGITSVTVTEATASTASVIILEVSGLNGTVDGSNFGGGSVAGTTQKTPVISPSARAFVIGGINLPSGTLTLDQAGSTPNSGWTDLTTHGDKSDASIAWQELAAGSNYQVSWTLGTSSKAGMVTIGFDVTAAVVARRQVLVQQAVMRSAHR